MGAVGHVLLRALPGIGQDDDASPGFVGGLHDGGKVVVESCRYHQHGGAKLIQGHEHLFRILRLGHDAHLIFHGQHLRDARPEDRLIIRQNQFEHFQRSPKIYEFLTNS